MSIVDDYYAALRGVGIMNFGGVDGSGEGFFLDRYLGGLPAPVVFDVGAHRGEYANRAIKAAPGATVYAFEPHPVTFAALQANVQSPRIRTINCGAGERNESLQLFDCIAEGGSHYASLHRSVLELSAAKVRSSVDVSIRRLDDMAAELEVREIDLLKIDTEGHELAALRGAERLLAAGKVRAVQFEFNEACIASRVYFRDFWDFLPNYNFYRILPNGLIYIQQYVPAFCEVFAFQNIVCLRKDVQFA